MYDRQRSLDHAAGKAEGAWREASEGDDMVFLSRAEAAAAEARKAASQSAEAVAKLKQDLDEVKPACGETISASMLWLDAREPL